MCGGKVISLGLKILCYRSNSISCRQVSQLSHAGIFYLLILLVIFLTNFIWILDIFLYPFAKAHIGWLQQSMSSRPGCTLNGLSSVSNFIVALNTAETPQPQLFRFKECVIRLNGPCWRLFTLYREGQVLYHPPPQSHVIYLVPNFPWIWFMLWINEVTLHKLYACKLIYILQVILHVLIP